MQSFVYHLKLNPAECTQKWEPQGRAIALLTLLFCCFFLFLLVLTYLLSVAWVRKEALLTK